MPLVLTTASSITCPSSGTVSTEGQSKLKVVGASVVRLDGVMGRTIENCTVETNQNAGTKKCGSVASASGVAIKLKVSGGAVALETLTGATDGLMPPTTPPLPLSVTANQTKLKAS